MRNPIKRLFAFIGLLFLAPIGYLLINGQLTVVDAAIRATATLVVVLVATRLALWGLDLMAGQLERAARPRPTHRRATDAGEP